MAHEMSGLKTDRRPYFGHRSSGLDAGTLRTLIENALHFFRLGGQFGASGTMGRLHLEAIEAIIGAATERHGHRVSVGLRPPHPINDNHGGPDGDRPVSIDVRLDGPGRAHAHATVEFAGFRSTYAAGRQEAADTLRNVYGAPRSIDVYDIGVPPEQFARTIAGDDDSLIANHRNYPAHV